MQFVRGAGMESKRGGAGRGQGRKPIAKDGELMRARPVRMTDEEWAKCKRLGGAAWVRAKIKAARET
jgi:hypothetical protein